MKQKNFILDNLKVMIYSFIAILIMRHSLFGFYKIPTTSMEPTLIGDPKFGDCIITNKVIYQFQKPKRWDVVIFRYPLNQQQIFIKRLIGLPGEDVSIKNGNIFINQKIVHKEIGIQKKISYPLFKQAYHKLKDLWQLEGEGWYLKNNKLFLETKTTACAYFKQRITNLYSYRKLGFSRKIGGNKQVGEYLLEFQLKALKGYGSVFIKFQDGENNFLLNLDFYPEKYHTLFYKDKLVKKFKQKLSPQKQYGVLVSNFDKRIQIFINKRLLAQFSYAKTLKKTIKDIYKTGVKLGGKEGSFSFSGINLYRDNYYISRKTDFAGLCSWKVPKGHYFVLGDNSPVSRDSRDWAKFCLICKDGTVLEGDQKSFPYTENKNYCFYDKHGIYHKIFVNEVKREITNIYSPFIPCEQLMGKAICVFWPLNRIKLIR